MSALRPRRGAWLALGVALASLGVAGTPLSAQSLTEGALRGQVVLADGTPVSAFSLTLEDASGVVLRRFTVDVQGRFLVPLLAPGNYVVLAEKSGYQPLRQRGIEVVADATTDVTIRVVRRPPPITAVEEVAIADQRISRSAPAVGQLVDPEGVTGLGRRGDLSELGRNTALVTSPRDGTGGFAEVFGGLPQPGSRLLVDGLPGSWFRHPARDADAGPTPVYDQLLFGDAQVFTHPVDVELMGGNGGMLTAVSRSGSTRFRFAPFATWSGKLGIPTIQNPGDSSLTSFQGGGTVSGVLVPDRATYIVGARYLSQDLPASNPWDPNDASLGGNAVALRSAFAQVASDSFGTALGSYVAPALRHTSGGSGGFRVDWRLSPNHLIVARANFSRYTETSPEVTGDVLNGAGDELAARDFSSMLSLVSALGSHTANEFRFGIRRSRRDWSGTSLPATYLVAEGAGAGTSPALPGNFLRTAVDFSDVVQFGLGHAGQHRVKIGVQYSNGYWEQDYLYGQHGIFSFGDLDGFAQGRGAFYVAEAANTRTRTSVEEVGLFTQLIYRLAPSLQLLGGVRWDRQKYPRQASQPIKPDPLFATLFGVTNSRLPDDKNNIGPRLGLLYTGGPRGEWIGSLGLSREYGQLNPATFAEARLNDGPVTIRRGVGSFGGWPGLPDTVFAPRIGQQVTLFNPKLKGYKNPRTFKADAELARQLAPGLTARVYGGYHHTDYLLRRTDLNLLPGPTGLTQEGRPVYGTLLQEGGMLVAQPGSNRAVQGFDLVSGLSSTGFQDHYEAGLSVTRESEHGLALAASYTFSRTRDNWLQSWTGDPTDALSPFPQDRLGHEWAEGISDYDIPQRAVVVATWHMGGSAPITLGARYRFRSGLPYTPGFRPGVDANADGSGRNDPAYVDPGIPGLSQVIAAHACLQDQQGHMAARNSCRADANHSIDISAAIGLPVRALGGARLELTAEVLNLASTPIGIVDRALVLVDPAGTLTTDSQGNVTLPLIANPRFGSLLSRRTEPRMVRLGLRVAY